MGVLVALLMLDGVVGWANTYTVTDPTDGNATNQLRGAILDASATGGGPHTINVAAGTYNLTLGEIVFGASPVTISIVGAGAGSTIINMTATAQDRIFIINTTGSISNVQVAISGITFKGGHLRSDLFGGGAILGGGPSNSITLSNCIFQGNSIDGTAGTHGGAIAMTAGGSLSIDHCQFLTNNTPTGEGGAIYYAPPNNVSGSLTITNSSFSNNFALGGSGSGGAISIHLPGALGGVTSSVSLQQDVIIGNQAAVDGGGLYVVNSFSATNTVQLNYNRIVGNVAGNSATYGVGVVSSQGNVDATHNWWGCNTNPGSGAGCNPIGIIGSGGTGTVQTSPWLELTSTAGATSVCSGNVVPVIASFLKNSAGSSVAATNLGALTGLSVSFSASSGSLSATQNPIQADGTASVDLIANGSTGTVSVHPQVDNVPANDVAAVSTVTVSASAVTGTSVSASGTISADNTYITDGSCNRIARVVPSGASPVSGAVTASVTIDATQSTLGGSPYVKRHYVIDPAANGTTATATITLYASQGEFDSYNTAMPGTANDLPVGPSDATGKANLRITQSHTSGAAVLIDPGTANVNWNATTGFWEISFDVTGFSNFYITGLIAAPLPVKLVSFTAAVVDPGVRLEWTVEEEENVNRYEMERSGDGVSFQRTGKVDADGGHRYGWLDATPLAGESWYRLRMVDNDGKDSYSRVLVVHRKSSVWQIGVSPNPCRDQVWLTLSTPQGADAGTMTLELLDLAGKVLLRQEPRIQAGANTFLVTGLDRFSPGVYFLRMTGREVNQTIKLVKTE